MRCRHTVFALAVALLAAVTASPVRRAAADPGDEVSRREAELSAFQAGRGDLAARQAALDTASRAQAAEIERLKGQPAGIVRDARLGELLAAARQRADEQSRIAAGARSFDARIEGARDAVAAACRIVLRDPRTGAARRLAVAAILRRTEGEQAAARRVAELRVAPPAAIDPLEGPADLADRADRLRDDVEKIEREAVRIAQRIERLEDRLRLRERAVEMSDDLFIEWSIGRRATRPANAPPARGQEATAERGGAGTLAAGAQVTDTKTTFDGSGPGPSAAPPPTTIRGVVDPATLAELRRAESGQDPESELALLRRARTSLVDRAAELARHEAELRRRAAELRRSR